LSGCVIPGFRAIRERGSIESLNNTPEKISDGSAVKAGRDDRITLDQCTELVFDIVGLRVVSCE